MARKSSHKDNAAHANTSADAAAGGTKHRTKPDDPFGIRHLSKRGRTYLERYEISDPAQLLEYQLFDDWVKLPSLPTTALEIIDWAAAHSVTIGPISDWLVLLKSAEEARLSLYCRRRLWDFAYRRLTPKSCTATELLTAASWGKLARIALKEWLAKHADHFGISPLDDLPPKIMHRLSDALRIRTPEQLVATFTEEELLAQDGFGSAVLEIIKEWLARHGQGLRHSDLPAPNTALTRPAQELIHRFCSPDNKSYNALELLVQLTANDLAIIRAAPQPRSHWNHRQTRQWAESLGVKFYGKK